MKQIARLLWSKLLFSDLQSEKIREIVNFKSPKNANELKSFFGVMQFLRKFVNERAILTAPFYDLLKKNKIFIWDDDLYQNYFR